MVPKKKRKLRKIELNEIVVVTGKIYDLEQDNEQSRKIQNMMSDLAEDMMIRGGQTPEMVRRRQQFLRTAQDQMGETATSLTDRADWALNDLARDGGLLQPDQSREFLNRIIDEPTIARPLRFPGMYIDTERGTVTIEGAQFDTVDRDGEVRPFVLNTETGQMEINREYAVNEEEGDTTPSIIEMIRESVAASIQTGIEPFAPAANAVRRAAEATRNITETVNRVSFGQRIGRVTREIVNPIAEGPIQGIRDETNFMQMPYGEGPLPEASNEPRFSGSYIARASRRRYWQECPITQYREMVNEEELYFFIKEAIFNNAESILVNVQFRNETTYLLNIVDLDERAVAGFGRGSYDFYIRTYAVREFMTFLNNGRGDNVWRPSSMYRYCSVRNAEDRSAAPRQWVARSLG